jgi:hypothetical protein
MENQLHLTRFCNRLFWTIAYYINQMLAFLREHILTLSKFVLGYQICSYNHHSCCTDIKNKWIEKQGQDLNVREWNVKERTHCGYVTRLL